MGISKLLDELIRVSKKPKTDFALHMNISPSGLSKILSGARLPQIRDRWLFARQTADYFAETIYSHECYIKLKEVFPVIYNFESRNDFHSFIEGAVTYSLDISYAVENGLKVGFTERGIYSMGTRSVTNQVCAVLSNCIRTSAGEQLEVFAALPLTSGIFSGIFKNIVWFAADGSPKPVLNYYFMPDKGEDFGDIGGDRLLEVISRVQKIFDLNLCRANHMPDYFLFVKGRALLFFSAPHGAPPILIPIFNKRNLSLFHGNLLKDNNEKISFGVAEAIDLIEKDKSLVDNLIAGGIDGVYNFISIGYMLRDKELDPLSDKVKVRDAILSVFSAVLTEQSISFYVSEKAMWNFSLHGTLIAPLLGTVVLPSERRTAYMHRFSEYLPGDYYNKLKIISSNLFGISVLCAKDFCIIYTIDDATGQEKTHVLKSSLFAAQIQEKMSDSNWGVTDFSPDLWGIYLDTLENSLD